MEELNIYDFFYKTELGNICKSLVHDTNNSTGRINNYVWLIKEELKNKDTLDLHQIKLCLEYILSASKEVNKAVDYSYIQLKEIEQNKLK